MIMNWFEQIYQNIASQKAAFFGIFFVVTLISYALLYSFDWYPEPVGSHSGNEEELVNEAKTVAVGTSFIEESVARAMTDEQINPTETKPVRIFIDALNREVPVLNPATSTIEAMDKALLEGIVRHPDTADFEKTGNMLLLGHSSYLPTVFNRNFQAFNGIQKLQWGDKIRLQSETTEYVYKVTRVREEKSTEVIIPYDWGESKITLVTCNVYGAKEDRFIVEAVLVESYPL